MADFDHEADTIATLSTRGATNRAAVSHTKDSEHQSMHSVGAAPLDVNQTARTAKQRPADPSSLGSESVVVGLRPTRELFVRVPLLPSANQRDNITRGKCPRSDSKSNLNMAPLGHVGAPLSPSQELEPRGRAALYSSMTNESSVGSESNSPNAKSASTYRQFIQCITQGWLAEPDSIVRMAAAERDFLWRLLRAPTVRIYLSSMLDPHRCEREALWAHCVLPIREFARQHGLEVEIVDPQWGLTSTGHGAFTSATNSVWETLLKRSLSFPGGGSSRAANDHVVQAGPAFVMLVGSSIGPVPLPLYLPIPLYERLRVHISKLSAANPRGQGATALRGYDNWYVLDKEVNVAWLSHPRRCIKHWPNARTARDEWDAWCSAMATMVSSFSINEPAGGRKMLGSSVAEREAETAMEQFRTHPYHPYNPYITCYSRSSGMETGFNSYDDHDVNGVSSESKHRNALAGSPTGEYDTCRDSTILDEITVASDDASGDLRMLLFDRPVLTPPGPIPTWKDHALALSYIDPAGALFTTTGHAQQVGSDRHARLLGLRRSLSLPAEIHRDDNLNRGGAPGRATRDHHDDATGTVMAHGALEWKHVNPRRVGNIEQAMAMSEPHGDSLIDFATAFSKTMAAAIKRRAEHMSRSQTFGIDSETDSFGWRTATQAGNKALEAMTAEAGFHLGLCHAFDGMTPTSAEEYGGAHRRLRLSSHEYQFEKILDHVKRRSETGAKSSGVMVVGPAGSGVGSLLQRAVVALATGSESPAFTVYRRVGSSAESGTAESIMKSITQQIRAAYGLPPVPGDQMPLHHDGVMQMFQYSMRSATMQAPLNVVIDGISRINGALASPAQRGVDWLPAVSPGHCALIAGFASGTTEALRYEERLIRDCGLGAVIVKVGPLLAEDAQSILSLFLDARRAFATPPPAPHATLDGIIADLGDDRTPFAALCVGELMRGSPWAPKVYKRKVVRQTAARYTSRSETALARGGDQSLHGGTGNDDNASGGDSDGHHSDVDSDENDSDLGHDQGPGFGWVVELTVTPTIRNLVSCIFSRMEEAHGQILVRHVCRLFAAAPSGLTSMELQDALSLDPDMMAEVMRAGTLSLPRFPPHLWLALRHDLDPFLMDRQPVHEMYASSTGATIAFAHCEFRWEIERRYCQGPCRYTARAPVPPTENGTSWAKAHAVLARYFMGDAHIDRGGVQCKDAVGKVLPFRDSIIVSQERFQIDMHSHRSPNRRRLTLGVYHLLRAGRTLEAAHEVCSLQYVEGKFLSGYSSELCDEMSDVVATVDQAIQDITRKSGKPASEVDSSVESKEKQQGCDRDTRGSNDGDGGTNGTSLAVLKETYSRVWRFQRFVVAALPMMQQCGVPQALLYQLAVQHAQGTVPRKSAIEALQHGHTALTLFMKCWGGAALGNQPHCLAGFRGLTLRGHVAMGSGCNCDWNAQRETGCPLQGHSNCIVHVAWSHTGDRVASVSFDNTVKLWDTSTGREVMNWVFSREAAAPTASEPMVQFTKRGDVVLARDTGATKYHPGEDPRRAGAPLDAVGASSTVWGFSIWQVATANGAVREATLRECDIAEAAMSLAGRAGSVIGNRVAWSVDKRYVVSGEGRDVVVRVHTNATEVLRFQGHDGVVNSLCFDPLGTRLASVAGDNDVIIWDFREALSAHQRMEQEQSDGAVACASGPGGPAGLYADHCGLLNGGSLAPATGSGPHRHPERPLDLVQTGGEVLALCVSNDCKSIACYTFHGVAAILNTSTGAVESRIAIPTPSTFEFFPYHHADAGSDVGTENRQSDSNGPDGASTPGGNHGPSGSHVHVHGTRARGLNSDQLSPPSSSARVRIWFLRTGADDLSDIVEDSTKLVLAFEQADTRVTVIWNIETNDIEDWLDIGHLYQTKMKNSSEPAAGGGAGHGDIINKPTESSESLLKGNESFKLLQRNDGGTSPDGGEGASANHDSKLCELEPPLPPVAGLPPREMIAAARTLHSPTIVSVACTAGKRAQRGVIGHEDGLATVWQSRMPLASPSRGRDQCGGAASDDPRRSEQDGDLGLGHASGQRNDHPVTGNAIAVNLEGCCYVGRTPITAICLSVDGSCIFIGRADGIVSAFKAVPDIAPGTAGIESPSSWRVTDAPTLETRRSPNRSQAVINRTGSEDITGISVEMKNSLALPRGDSNRARDSESNKRHNVNMIVGGTGTGARRPVLQGTKPATTASTDSSDGVIAAAQTSATTMTVASSTNKTTEKRHDSDQKKSVKFIGTSATVAKHAHTEVGDHTNGTKAMTLHDKLSPPPHRPSKTQTNGGNATVKVTHPTDLSHVPSAVGGGIAIVQSCLNPADMGHRTAGRAGSEHGKGHSRNGVHHSLSPWDPLALQRSMPSVPRSRR